jgi:hypothetical protein
MLQITFLSTGKHSKLANCQVYRDDKLDKAGTRNVLENGICRFGLTTFQQQHQQQQQQSKI